jgi:hypothetical protein
VAEVSLSLLCSGIALELESSPRPPLHHKGSTSDPAPTPQGANLFDDAVRETVFRVGVPQVYRAIRLLLTVACWLLLRVALAFVCC